MSKAKELVEVYRSPNQMEAEVIKSLLESFNIPCVLRTHGAPSAFAFTVDGMGEVRVMVAAATAELARQLIRGKDGT